MGSGAGAVRSGSERGEVGEGAAAASMDQGSGGRDVSPSGTERGSLEAEVVPGAPPMSSGVGPRLSMPSEQSESILPPGPAGGAGERRGEAVGLGTGGGERDVRTLDEGSAGEQLPPRRRDDVDDAAQRPAETAAPDPYRWSLAQRAAYRAHLLPAVMERRPTDLAAHAPLVTRAADEGDEVARQILDEAAAALVETVMALAPEPGEPLVVTGGLLAPEGPLLAPLIEHLAPLGLTVSPVVDGSAGAVALARIAAAR